MKILEMLAPGPVGGLERVVQALGCGFQSRGHEVHVAAILDAPATEHAMLPQLRAGGVTVHALPIPHRHYRQERAEVAALLRRIQPDIVHTHGTRADVVDGPVAIGLGIPTMSTIHGFTLGGLKNRAYEIIQKQVLRQYNMVVAVARFQQQEVNIRPDRFRFIPNAWWPGETPCEPATARHMLSVPPDRFHVGFVGRLAWEKGPDVFLDAVAQLRDLPLQVSVIGDGRERKALEEQARRLALMPHTTFWGIVRSVDRLIPAFDAFVMPSRREGTPMLLFEAMNAGAPIVVAPVGGVADVITEEEALLVPTRDARATAAAIRRIQRDPAAAHARALRAKARLKQFAPGPWLDQYEELYEQLTGRVAVTAA